MTSLYPEIPFNLTLTDRNMVQATRTRQEVRSRDQVDPALCKTYTQIISMPTAADLSTWSQPQNHQTWNQDERKKRTFPT
jgi:hypothetical protein